MQDVTAGACEPALFDSGKRRPVEVLGDIQRAYPGPGGAIRGLEDHSSCPYRVTARAVHRHTVQCPCCSAGERVYRPVLVAVQHTALTACPAVGGSGEVEPVEVIGGDPDPGVGGPGAAAVGGRQCHPTAARDVPVTGALELDPEQVVGRVTGLCSPVNSTVGSIHDSATVAHRPGGVCMVRTHRLEVRSRTGTLGQEPASLEIVGLPGGADGPAVIGGGNKVKPIERARSAQVRERRPVGNHAVKFPYSPVLPGV